MKAFALLLLTTIAPLANASEKPKVGGVCEFYETATIDAQPEYKPNKLHSFRFGWGSGEEIFEEFKTTVFAGMEVQVAMGPGAIGEQKGLGGLILFKDIVAGFSMAEDLQLNYVETPDGKTVPGASWSRTYNRKTADGEVSLSIDCHVNQPFKP
ncbi:MAG: hypothetical protein EOP04_01990 [Proteobacteria bacterium]|nr:MAG: hypothetical protein EOP04_01990 [Pseudomonadota bacterium]